MDKEKFLTPAPEFRMKAIIHQWPENCELLMDAVKDFGYGGVATNPDQRNGYTSNPENLSRFDEIIHTLKRKDLDYWIYDEKGYPSGYGGGLSLDDHPELEAKGLYMVRRLAIEPKHGIFHLDEESDKIVWAAKYPVDHSKMNASIILFEKMEKVPFSADSCEYDLKENEVLFIFCVKSAYEGSHLTHNVCSRSRYINILDPEAVRRFLDVCYEPIAQASPDAYRNACAVFTDEPSLVTAYIQGDEVWPYALVPWKEGLFEDFQEEYGYSLLPYLPQIFEGRNSSWTARVHFYQLIGKLAARSYTEQISRWCHEHGGRFSGHYLAEESLRFHVLYYGSYLEVLKASDYPGVDVLAACPDIYHPNTVRYAQMAARKMGTNGLMAELCPFIDIRSFEKDPVLNATGILNLLYLGGCRCVNSYLSSNFSSWDSGIPDRYSGYLSRDQARFLNEYAGRMGYVLDGVQNDCGTFVYYPLEDAQAKTRPEHCASESVNCDTDRGILSLTGKLFEAGFDYLFADRDDLVLAAENIAGGEENAAISGIRVRNIIVSPVDVIWPDAWDACEKLKESGVNVWFVNKIPTERVGDRVQFEPYDFREESLQGPKCTETKLFRAMTEEEILCRLREQEELRLAEEPRVEDVSAPDGCRRKNVILKARYVKDGRVVYFVVNNSRQDVSLSWSMKGWNTLEIWDPADGSVRMLSKDEKLEIPAFRGIFLVETV